MAMKISTSLAAKAFQFTQDNSGDFWEYLEHIEAPQWVDLAVEASLQGTEGDDPWFYKHHPHHETPLEDLVFLPGHKLKEKFRKQFEEDLEFKSDALKTTQKSDEAHKNEQGRIKAKRVEVLPDTGSRNDAGKQDQKPETHSSPRRPSDAFSTKLLATLMARLRTSGEMQTSLNENSLSDSKPASQKTTEVSSSPEVQSSVLNVRKLRVRASIATVPLSTRETSMKRERHQIKSSPLKGDKENTTKSPGRRAKVTIPQLEQVKKSRTLQARRSLASLEFGKNNVHGSFSIGRGDSSAGAGAGAPRRRLSSNTSKSPRLRNGCSAKVIGKPSRTFIEQSRGEKSRVASNSSSREACKAKALGESGDDLAALIAKHNSKFKPKPKYEPRLHSTRDIREWERRTGLQYYNLQPVERVRVNQEISDFKRSKIP